MGLFFDYHNPEKWPPGPAVSYTNAFIGPIRIRRSTLVKPPTPQLLKYTSIIFEHKKSLFK
jgi:hypothetical protein